jgi:TRAP-type C4-dicarboxylate transport system permease large subunit
MVIKIIVLVLLLFILYALGSGVYFLIHDGEKRSKNMVKALSWRIGLSLVVFVFLIIAFFMGWITPHPLFTGPPQ